ncbi:MAG: hypothetical protein ACI8RD_002053 [Bacillariaceae sp.]|jgi:hypothetical protein
MCCNFKIVVGTNNVEQMMEQYSASPKYTCKRRGQGPKKAPYAKRPAF